MSEGGVEPSKPAAVVVEAHEAGLSSRERVGWREAGLMASRDISSAESLL